MTETNAPATDLVLALVHSTCGHACGVSTDDRDLYAYMKRARLGPEWEIEELSRDDAVARYRAGSNGIMSPCGVCAINGAES
jgi:Tfp pilus assembly protein PilP